ncbi:MAG: cytochrome c [Vicinamibacterales bacterium]
MAVCRQGGRPFAAARGATAAMVAMFATVVAVAQTPASRSTFSGVYTEEQAKRGQSVYVGECAFCHAQDLSGNESPALVGEGFSSAWDGQTVGDLFDRVKTTMPQDSPGRLGLQEYTDLVAFLLSANGFPAGSKELGRDMAVLKLIRWDKNPKAALPR